MRFTDAEREKLKRRAAAMHAKGVSYSEIARRLGVSLPTVMVWLKPEYQAHKLAYNNQRFAQSEVKEAFREYANREDRRERVREREADRRKNDVQFRLAKALRARIRSAVIGKSKAGSAVDDLGCSIAFLRRRLERRFKPGMTWANHGSAWHIDHIKPLSRFDLTDRDEFLEAVNWRNLQPLWASENLSKNDRLDWRRQRKAAKAKTV